jgi:hypothetical protein
MKRIKNRIIKLSEQDALSISNALTAYASAAYPCGGSECSQASHQTLLEIANKIGQSYMVPIEIKKRQLPTIKVALKWYFEENAGQPQIPNYVDQLITKLKNG